MIDSIFSIIIGCCLLAFGISILYDPQIYIVNKYLISLRPFHQIISMINILLGLYLIISNIKKLFNN